MLSLTTIAYTVLALVLVPAVATIWGILKWLVSIKAIGKQIDKIPGPPRSFLLGNMSQIPLPSEKQLEWHIDQAKKYKTHFSFWFGPFRPAVGLCHPSTAKLLAKTAEPKPLSGKGGYALLLDWLGLGLLLNSGKSWFRNRRLLTPAFHFDVLKPYMQVYNEASDIFIEKVLDASNAADNEQRSVEIYRPVSLCTLNVMMRCAFSYEEDIQRQGDNNPYVKAVAEMAQLFIDRIFNPLLYPDTVYYKTKAGKRWLERCDYAHQTAYKLINQRRNVLESQGPATESKRAMDFLDILLLARDDSGEGLTDLEIRQEVDTFLFEGHDTTASGLAWCLYNLASHPEYQEKARQEVDDLLEDRDNDNIEWDDMNKLPYLTMCLKESLRHTPPVPFTGRELENPLTLGDVTLKPGSFIDIYIWTIHHNADIWGEDHMEYKPDRFLPENMKNMDSHAFIPFSAGPRNCIGQNFAMNEMKTFLAKVLRRFTLEIDPKKKPERLPQIVMKAVDGINLIIKERV